MDDILESPKKKQESSGEQLSDAEMMDIDDDEHEGERKDQDMD